MGQGWPTDRVTRVCSLITDTSYGLNRSLVAEDLKLTVLQRVLESRRRHPIGSCQQIRWQTPNISPTKVCHAVEARVSNPGRVPF